MFVRRSDHFQPVLFPFLRGAFRRHGPAHVRRGRDGHAIMFPALPQGGVRMIKLEPRGNALCHFREYGAVQGRELVKGGVDGA